MKSHLFATLFLTCAILAPVLSASDVVAGPKGGRLLDAPPHRAEFFVTPDRRAEITFYGADMKPVSHDGHIVSVTAELPSGRKTIVLTQTESGFVSAEPLPAGEPYRVVVQFRTGPQAKATNHRLDLNLSICGECQHAEYACTCAH